MSLCPHGYTAFYDCPTCPPPVGEGTMSDQAEYVVWSFEHGQWWRPFHSGYTPRLSEAGRYFADEAGAIVTNSVMGEEVAILVQTAAMNGAPTVRGLWEIAPSER